MSLGRLMGNTTHTPNDGEYIYNMNLVWSLNSWTSERVSPGIIVTNVKKLPNNSFTFNIKGNTQTLYRTNYGWSFIENTPDNIAKYNEYLRVKSVISTLQLENDVLFSNIIHLGEQSC